MRRKFVWPACAASVLAVAMSSAAPPVIERFTVSPETWTSGSLVEVSCFASDPEATALSWQWTAEDGSLSGAANQWRARWNLPAEDGNPMLLVEVRDAAGESVSAEFLLPVGPVREFHTLRPRGTQPVRAAVDSEHRVWVTDPARNVVARISPSGLVLSEFTTGPGPLGIALAADGSILVGEDGLDRVVRYSRLGGVLGVLGSGSGEVRMPNAIEVDSGTGRIYVVNSKENEIRIYSPQGAFLSAFGAAMLDFPVDIAVDSTAHELYVADQGSSRILVFNLSGQLVRQFGSAGYLPGQFGRLRAIQLDGQGHCLVLDGYQNQVQLLTLTGEPVTSFGYFGQWYGSLRTSLDLALDPQRQIYVTSPGMGTIESYAWWATISPSGEQGWMLF